MKNSEMPEREIPKKPKGLIPKNIENAVRMLARRAIEDSVRNQLIPKPVSKQENK
jgi:hypothetical protein